MKQSPLKQPSTRNKKFTLEPNQDLFTIHGADATILGTVCSGSATSLEKMTPLKPKFKKTKAKPPKLSNPPEKGEVLPFNNMSHRRKFIRKKPC